MAKFFHDHFTHKARKSVQRAMRNLSRRTAEREYHQMLSRYHTGEAAQIDPNTNWWDFAEQKQLAHDHEQDALVESRRVTDAQALVDAAQTRYRKLVQGK